MARKTKGFGRFLGGLHGLERESFKTDPTLKWISDKARKSAIASLAKHRKSGGGLSRREVVHKAYSEWRKDKGDDIDPRKARLIKERLMKQIAEHEQEQKEDRRQKTDLSDIREGRGADRFLNSDRSPSEKPGPPSPKSARESLSKESDFDTFADEDEPTQKPRRDHDRPEPKDSPDRPTGYDSPHRDGQTSTW